MFRSMCTRPVLLLATLAACTVQTAEPPVIAGASPRLPVDGWIDATATLQPGRTPIYDGDAPIVFTFLKDMRNGDGFTLSKYDMGAHSGTHLDAPMHFIRDGAPVDQVGIGTLVGPARVIQVADSVQAIDTTELNHHEWKGVERILFRTRSTTKHWMDSATFHRDFAYITGDAAEAMAAAGVKLVGVDYISAEQFASAAPLAHRALLGKGIPIIEGLDLMEAPAGDYDLVILPLKVSGHEGAPARAILRPVR